MGMLTMGIDGSMNQTAITFELICQNAASCGFDQVILLLSDSRGNTPDLIRVRSSGGVAEAVQALDHAANSLLEMDPASRKKLDAFLANPLGKKV